MSQPGQKPAASPRPRRAAAARHTQELSASQVRGWWSASPAPAALHPVSSPGSPLRDSEQIGCRHGIRKLVHADGKTSGSPSKSGEKKGSDEVTTSSASTRKSSSMNPTETKAIPVSKQLEGLHSPNKKRHKKQVMWFIVLGDISAVKTEPEKKSQSTKPSVVHEKKTQEVKPKEHTEPKCRPKHSSDMGSKHTYNEKAVSRSSEQPTSEKSTIPKTESQDTISSGGKSAVTGIAAASGKPVDKLGMDAALDDLIDTLGEPEETKEDNTTYTGPEVLDLMSSTYIEELGKREVTLPPKYRELLNKKEGITGPPPDSSKPLGPDDAIDALSSDFTCSSPTADGKKTKKESNLLYFVFQKSTGEVLKAQSAEVIKSAAPPKEKKRKVEENFFFPSQDTMSDQALEALSASLGSRKPEPELDLSSIKEVNEAKAKEEKLKKCGEDEKTVPPEYRLKPATDKDGKPLLPDVEEKPKPLSESELIDELSEDLDQSKCKEKQSKPTEKTEEGMGPRDAVEALAGSLGIKEAGPEVGKPVEDKVKEKAKEEDREKLGEKEETIPPDYRLEEVKDKDGKPLLPKEPKEPLPPLSEDFLLDALSKDFAVPPSTSSLQSDDKELDDALDQLSDSLGQRQPDADEDKPLEDKVKGKSATPPTKKPEASKGCGEMSYVASLPCASSLMVISVKNLRKLQMPKTPLMPSQGTLTAVPQLQKPQKTQQRTKTRSLLPAPKHPRTGVKQRILQRQRRKLPSEKMMEKVQVKVHTI
ncbi:hypothetical protein EI555_015771, partial [Monodon monoceros]